ncbi:hypothetical protein [Cereibacter ovatus]|nr:hypothetical protein [Cereibacter ovatus]
MSDISHSGASDAVGQEQDGLIDAFAAGAGAPAQAFIPPTVCWRSPCRE